MFIPIEKISNLQEFKKDIFSGKVFVFQKSKTSNDLITQIKNKIQNIYDIELQVHQCWDCDSEGEFIEYVTEDDNNLVDDGVSVKLH